MKTVKITIELDCDETYHPDIEKHIRDYVKDRLSTEALSAWRLGEPRIDVCSLTLASPTGLIFCVGFGKSYDWYIEQNKSGGLPIRKMGCHIEQGYPGGSVWQTVEEAQKFADDKPGYKVYGLLADWEKDTRPSEGESWRDLLHDAELVGLERNE